MAVYDMIPDYIGDSDMAIAGDEQAVTLEELDAEDTDEE